MKKFITFIILVSIVLLNCSSANMEPKPAENFVYCKSGCLNLEKLGCKGSEPQLTPWECGSSSECVEENQCITGYCGMTCTNLCEEKISKGTNLKAKCWSEINSCSELNTKCGE